MFTYADDHLDHRGVLTGGRRRPVQRLQQLQGLNVFWSTHSRKSGSLRREADHILFTTITEHIYETGPTFICGCVLLQDSLQVIQVLRDSSKNLIHVLSGPEGFGPFWKTQPDQFLWLWHERSVKLLFYMFKIQNTSLKKTRSQQTRSRNLVHINRGDLRNCLKPSLRFVKPLIYLWTGVEKSNFTDFSVSRPHQTRSSSIKTRFKAQFQSVKASFLMWKTEKRAISLTFLTPDHFRPGLHLKPVNLDLAKPDWINMEAPETV